MTVHSFARGKLPRQNMMNDVRLFSRVLVNYEQIHPSTIHPAGTSYRNKQTLVLYT